MRNKIQKGRCIKLTLNNFASPVKTYDSLQLAAAKSLSTNSNFVDCRCNVDSSTVDGKQYTTDFLCIDKDGKYTAYECVWRKNLQKPRTMALLDASQAFWAARGIEVVLIIDKAEGLKEGDSYDKG